MKYFFDTEFIEGFKKPISWLPTVGRFNKPYHSIQLISIGIVCEDGREFYAISTEFNPKDADDWVKENVLSKLPERNVSFYDSPRMRAESLLYHTNKEIAVGIKQFVFKGAECSANIEHWGKDIPIDFYAYYADYDWVVFCSLFGKMIDLPTGFPMYCRDLKQVMDEKAMRMTSKEATAITCPSCTHDMYEYLEKTTEGKYKINVIKSMQDYPRQDNEHSALDDAKWNFKLYKFLQAL